MQELNKISDRSTNFLKKSEHRYPSKSYEHNKGKLDFLNLMKLSV